MFSIRGLRLYFPTLEPWVVWSASLPCCSSGSIYTRMWGRRVCQPPPCRVCKLQPGLLHSTIRHLAGSSSHHLALSPLCPGCPSPPLLPVWMNVSSLFPWLSDFHTVRFCQFWLIFVLKLLLCKEAQYVYLRLHLGRKSKTFAFTKKGVKLKWHLAFVLREPS